MPGKAKGHRLRHGRYSETGRIYLITAVCADRSPRFGSFAEGRCFVHAIRRVEHQAATLCYVLHPAIAGTKAHGFVVAQHLRPGSFVSFETALAWQGWIPEAVRLVTSVVPGRRKSDYSIALWGDFRFVPLAQRRGYGLVGVRRVELTGGIGLVADPLRALLDLICWRKIAPESVPSFLQGLRLEPEWQSAVQGDALTRLRQVYQHRRMGEVIDLIAGEYAHD